MEFNRLLSMLILEKRFNPEVRTTDLAVEITKLFVKEVIDARLKELNPVLALDIPRIEELQNLKIRLGCKDKNESGRPVKKTKKIP